MSENQKLTDVTMPQLAESLVSATIAKWLKKPGDFIEQYEPICEVITDKVNAEIPSTLDGVMGDILAQEGQTVNVGDIICRIAVASGEGTAPSPQPAAAASASPQQGAGSEEGSMRFRYSPAVQTLAAEHQIDLSKVQGSGMGGRITRKDVLAYIEKGGQPKAKAKALLPDRRLSLARKRKEKQCSRAGLRRFKVCSIRRLRNRRLLWAQPFRMCAIRGCI